jgi:hypothetical protein
LPGRLGNAPGDRGSGEGVLDHQVAEFAAMLEILGQ